MYFIYIFLFVWTFKIINNIINYFNAIRLYKIWWSCFSKDNENAVSYKQNIIKLFKNAGLKDNYEPISVPTGYGMVTTTKTSLFDNIFYDSKKNAGQVKQYFLEAKGVYRSRIFESFNPIYWIKCCIFLPKMIIEYLGLNSDTIFTKISQIIFWLIDSILIVKFKDQILGFIETLITKLFS